VADLSPEYLNKGPILLSQSILDNEAFRTRDVVYVENEQTDPRVLYSAEARREGLVSALIAPLIYKDRPVGALRLYTDRPHRFSPYETALVKAVAAQAAAAIVNAQLYNQHLQAEAMRRQVRLAGEVQRRMIPERPPRVGGLDLAAVYVPSLDLSGDFYDFIELPAGNLGVVICDVMGKGVPASLLMASIRASLRAHVSNLYDLSEALRRVNRSLCDDTLISSFATLFYGVINTRIRQLTYSNAGHEPPMLVRDGKVQRLSTGGTVLGIERDMRYNQDVVQLQPRDVLVLATDGVFEAMDFKEEVFGRARMEQAMMTAIQRGDDANGIAKHILWELRRFTGLQARTDDLTLVAVRVV
jgi:sigma-B regulation protein RsbU (phosphoserine phosphatase)